MGFLTPMYELGQYLEWTRSGEIQLPDFQRGYKWEDERIRQLLVTVLRGHPLGAVMLLKTGNSQVRFKPRADRRGRATSGIDAEVPAPRRTAATHIADAGSQRGRCGQHQGCARQAARPPLPDPHGDRPRRSRAG